MIKSFLAGVALGVLYDIVRILKMLCGVRYSRTNVKGGAAVKVVAYIVTFLTDVIFWITVGVVSILLMYGIGGGIFRGVTYVGLAFGMLIYHFSIGRLMLKVSEWTVAWLQRITRRALCVLIKPITLATRGIILLFHLTIGRIIGKIKEKNARRRDRVKIEIGEETASDTDGKEEFVYVDGKNGYKRDGRISFGRVGKGS